jgi:hypothetical protein
MPTTDDWNRPLGGSMPVGKKKGFDMFSNQQKSLLLCAATAVAAFALASSAQAKTIQKECPTVQGSIFAWQYPCAETQPERRKKRRPQRLKETDWKEVVLRGPSEGGGDGDGGGGGNGR